MTLIHHRAKLRLRAQGILVANQDGEEVLFGLDVAETRFVFSCTERGIADLGRAELALYWQLRHRHLQARVDELLLGGERPRR